MTQSINNMIQEMDIDELRMLNQKVVSRIKALKAMESEAVKDTINVGDYVSVDHKKLYGITCTVAKINRTRAVLEDPTGSRFSVPLRMVQVQ